MKVSLEVLRSYLGYRTEWKNKQEKKYSLIVQYTKKMGKST